MRKVREVLRAVLRRHVEHPSHRPQLGRIAAEGGRLLAPRQDGWGRNRPLPPDRSTTPASSCPKSRPSTTVRRRGCRWSLRSVAAAGGALWHRREVPTMACRRGCTVEGPYSLVARTPPDPLSNGVVAGYRRKARLCPSRVGSAERRPTQPVPSPRLLGAIMGPVLDIHTVARSLTHAEFTLAHADAITNAIRRAVERRRRRLARRRPVTDRSEVRAGSGRLHHEGDRFLPPTTGTDILQIF